MERSELITAYLDEVCAQVHWKQAHPTIQRELSDHIEDEQQSLLSQGFQEEAAEKQAIKEMGDALEVGRRFDEAYHPQKDWSVWIPFAVLMIFGFLARAYINEALFYAYDYTPVMLFAFFGACLIRAGWLPKWTWLLYGVYCAALFAATWGVFGVFARGYNQYVGYLLLFLPAISSLMIYRMRGRGIGGICLICIAHTVIALIALQSSIGNYILIALACICLLLYAIIRGWFECNKAIAALIVVGPPILLFTAMVVTHPYRFVQLLALISPEIDPQGVGFLGTTIREVLVAAKFIGPMDVALLDGVVVDYISRSVIFANDCMLTLLAAKLGKIVFFFAVALLLAFVLLALRICLKQRSMLGKLVCLSVVLTFAVQGAGYIAGNMGVTLLLRYPMPFVAMGNTAMLCNLVLCGLLFSTFRTGVLLDDGRLQKQPRWKIKLVRELD